MPENDPTFVKRRAPMLYVIIVVKLVKGVALLLLALGVYSLSGNDLPEEFRNMLRFLHLDPRLIVARKDIPVAKLPAWIRDAMAKIKPMPVDREVMAAHLDEWMKYWDANIRNRGHEQ